MENVKEISKEQGYITSMEDNIKILAERIKQLGITTNIMEDRIKHSGGAQSLDAKAEEQAVANNRLAVINRDITEFIRSINVVESQISMFIERNIGTK